MVYVSINRSLGAIFEDAKLANRWTKLFVGMDAQILYSTTSDELLKKSNLGFHYFYSFSFRLSYSEFLAASQVGGNLSNMGACLLKNEA